MAKGGALTIVPAQASPIFFTVRKKIKMSNRRLKFWGWGFEDTLLQANEIALLEANYAKHLGMSGFQAIHVPKAEEISLRKPRLDIPSSLQKVCMTDHYERLLHSYGKSFFDSARADRKSVV